MMQRPMIWFSAAFAVGCGVVLLYAPPFPLAVGAVLLALAVAVGSWNTKLLPICVLVGGMVCGMSYTMAYHRYLTEPVSNLENTSRKLTVTVVDFASHYSDRQRVAVRVQGIDVDCPVNFRTLLYLPTTEQTLAPGDIITGKVEFYIPDQLEGFDRAGYYRTQGYAVLASIKTGAVVTTPTHRPLSYYPKQLAEKMKQVFFAGGSERQAAFWTALTTGDRTNLTTTDTDHLRKAGLSHVIALSGLHVGFLISILLFVFGRRMGTLLGIPVLAAFYLMVGWSPSVARACLMYGILLLSFWLKKQADGINSLFAALLLILIFMPDALGSVSLQLSFISTLGILCFAGRIQRLFILPKKLPKLVRHWYRLSIGILACSFCSMLFTTPILLYHFGYLSVFSLLSNILALWAVSAVFPLVVFGALTGLIIPTITPFFLIPAGWLTDYIYWVSDWTASLPYGLLYRENNVDFILAVGICLVTTLLLWNGKRRICMLLLPVLTVAVVGISMWRGANGQNDLRIAILPEGSGQAIVLSCGDQAALIDCSGSGYHNAAQDVAAYLDWWGIDSLDLLVLTSVDLGHARNTEELLHTVSVEQVLLPEVNRESKVPYPTLLQCLEQEGIAYQKIAPESETPVGDTTLGLSVLGVIERKLTVHVISEDQDILIIHALTQNMLLELTEQVPLSCHTLVVSGGFADDPEKQKCLLDRILPKQIVLENGWKSGSDYYGIPILNPYAIGEIDWKTVRE